MKRICDLITDDIFYLHHKRCKVLEIKNGILYYGIWYEGRYVRDTASNQLRAGSQYRVVVKE